MAAEVSQSRASTQDVQGGLPITEQIVGYLLQKLKDAVEETKKAKHGLHNYLFHLQEEFEKLVKSIENREPPHLQDEAKRRETLYYLNNLLTEWDILGKKNNYTPNALIDARILAANLKAVRKNLSQVSQTGSEAGDKTGSTADTATPSATPPVSQHDANRSTTPRGTSLIGKELDTYRWSSRYVDRSKVYGLEDEEKFMERLLVRTECKDGFKGVGLYGMAGIGKSALCQYMLTNQKVKQHFLPRIWVCMSKQPEEEEDQDHRKEIVKRILLCLGVEDDVVNSIAKGKDDDGLRRLLFALRLQLRGKRYLIVLDDASARLNKDRKIDAFFCNLSANNKEISYDKLADGLPKGQGGTVIVTGRDETCVQMMVGEDNVHRLMLLKDEENCWKIFEDWARKDNKKFLDELKELKKLVIEKCAGLPLVAKMMGQIMNEQLPPDDTTTATGDQQDQNRQAPPATGQPTQ